MKYEWMDEYLLEKKGVTKDFQAEWNWIRYHIGGKMFAAICRDDDDTAVYHLNGQRVSTPKRGLYII